MRKPDSTLFAASLQQNRMGELRLPAEPERAVCRYSRQLASTAVVRCQCFFRRSPLKSAGVSDLFTAWLFTEPDRSRIIHPVRSTRAGHYYQRLSGRRQRIYGVLAQQVCRNSQRLLLSACRVAQQRHQHFCFVFSLVSSAGTSNMILSVEK